MNLALILTGLWFATMAYWCFLYGYRRVEEALIGVIIFWCIPMPQTALDTGLLVQFLIIIPLAVIVWASNWFYCWQFPVFEGSPYKTVQDRGGDSIHLYIRHWNGKYLVGIDYPISGEDAYARGRTRYVDRFPDFVTAENQLLRRCEEFVVSSQNSASI